VNFDAQARRGLILCAMHNYAYFIKLAGRSALFKVHPSSINPPIISAILKGKEKFEQNISKLDD